MCLPVCGNITKKDSKLTYFGRDLDLSLHLDQGFLDGGLWPLNVRTDILTLL